MVHADSPVQGLTTTPKSKTALAVKALFTRFFHRVKGFLVAQKLPHVAHKACEIYLGDTHQHHQAKCRRLLQTQLVLNPDQLRRFFHTAVGEDLLGWVERLFHLPNQPNPKQTLQEILVQMATDPEGLSLLSFLRRCPDGLQFNANHLALMAKQIEQIVQETDATLQVIRDLAAYACKTGPQYDFEAMPDLRSTGPWRVNAYPLVLMRSQITDQTEPLRILCYEPQPWPQHPVPIVVQSHGLAASAEDLAGYARHLASYGYFVIAPQHPGSDLDHVRQMLLGETPDVFSLSEFIDRPLDITAILDALERDSPQRLQGRLDLQRVGVMGYSFGAYTALALAGADLHFDTLELACDTSQNQPNLSLLLQCQALDLPRRVYRLRDPRVQAIVSLDSVGSEVFGAEGIGQIQIPVMLMSGSHDPIAPLILEQIRIFHWLCNPVHYLVLMQGKTHTHDAQRLMRNLNIQVTSQTRQPSTYAALARSTLRFEGYIHALSVAFLSRHLPLHPSSAHLDSRAQLPSDLQPYLSPQYAAYLSQTPDQLWCLSQNWDDVLVDQFRDRKLALMMNLLNLAPVPPVS